MKFLVRDLQTDRHRKIRSFLDEDNALIAVLLAAVDLEWTIRRTIDAMTKTDVSDKLISGLENYKKEWHVHRQRLWDQSGDLNKGGFLAHRNPKESEDEPEILCPTRPCAS